MSHSEGWEVVALPVGCPTGVVAIARFRLLRAPTGRQRGGWQLVETGRPSSWPARSAHPVPLRIKSCQRNIPCLYGYFSFPSLVREFASGWGGGERLVVTVLVTPQRSRWERGRVFEQLVGHRRWPSRCHRSRYVWYRTSVRICSGRNGKDTDRADVAPAALDPPCVGQIPRHSPITATRSRSFGQLAAPVRDVAGAGHRRAPRSRR